MLVDRLVTGLLGFNSGPPALAVPGLASAAGSGTTDDAPFHAGRRRGGRSNASMRLPTLALLLLAAGLAWSGEAAPAPKPWEAYVAALTDHRPGVHEPAITMLTRFGEPALADVASLATDADWRVRGRVVAVAAGIGGPSGSAVVLGASDDSDARVRELAALGLGRLPQPGVYQRLVALLADRSDAVRIASARGLAGLGDPRALPVLADFTTERDDPVRRARLAALQALVARPASVPALIEALGRVRGDPLVRLLAAGGQLGDPRLAPVLAGLLRSADRDAAELAALSLAANGDSRALEALCLAATNTGQRRLAEVAAETLRALTGHGAGPGQAWTLWWRDHASEVAGRAARDAFLADLHDPTRTVTRAELAAFTVEELMPLVDGVLGDGAWWWPRRAFAVLVRDDPARWTAPLVARAQAAQDPDVRLALTILIDQLGDPAAVSGLGMLLAETEQRAETARAAGGAPRNEPELIALRAALARRGVAPAPTPERAPFK